MEGPRDPKARPNSGVEPRQAYLVKLATGASVYPPAQLAIETDPSIQPIALVI